MHCSDEQLLAHLDGELAPWKRFRVEMHLRACWSCRTRRSACEAEIQKLTVAMDEWPLPAAEWRREASERLERRMQQVEANLGRPGERRLRRFAIPAVATAAVMVCVPAWLLWRSKPAPQLHAAEVIAQVSRVEANLYTQPIRQTFAVEIAEIRPSGRRTQANLQIWSDRRTGRFASQWSGEDGAVRHALWRPGSDAEFVYRPASSPGVRKQTPHRALAPGFESLAEHGWDPAQLEEAFLHWMESRSWNPISFAADLSWWIAEDGAVATAERIRGTDGAGMIRITAQHQSRRMVALLTMEVDAANHQPRLQVLRCETAERTVEFRLAAKSIETLSASGLSAAVFEPGPELARLSSAETRLPAREERGEKPRPVAEPAASEPALDPRTVEAQFVLHEALACMGEPVRVSEDSGGTRIERVGGTGASYQTGLTMVYMLGVLADLRRDQPPPGEGARAVAIRHAWAIRRLGKDFPPRTLDGLKPASWDMLQAMIREHTAGVREQVGSQGLRRSTERVMAAPWRAMAAELVELLSRPEPSLDAIEGRLDAIERDAATEGSRRDPEVR